MIQTNFDLSCKYFFISFCWQAYEKPLLESDPPLLEREKVKLIFYRVRGIYQCHLMFQIALASRVKTWEDSEVLGDVFVASVSILSVCLSLWMVVILNKVALLIAILCFYYSYQKDSEILGDVFVASLIVCLSEYLDSQLCVGVWWGGG